MDNIFTNPWLPYDEQLKQDIKEANRQLIAENENLKYFDKFWNK